MREKREGWYLCLQNRDAFALLNRAGSALRNRSDACWLPLNPSFRRQGLLDQSGGFSAARVQRQQVAPAIQNPDGGQGVDPERAHGVALPAASIAGDGPTQVRGLTSGGQGAAVLVQADREKIHRLAGKASRRPVAIVPVPAKTGADHEAQKRSTTTWPRRSARRISRSLPARERFPDRAVCRARRAVCGHR